VIDKVFGFDEVHAAYKHTASGAHFGKIVIDVAERGHSGHAALHRRSAEVARGYEPSDQASALGGDGLVQPIAQNSPVWLFGGADPGARPGSRIKPELPISSLHLTRLTHQKVGSPSAIQLHWPSRRPREHLGAE
jgi:hypothetical protein